MKIDIVQAPDTKDIISGHKRVEVTYYNGVPVRVRVVKHCKNCGVEIGGYFGNGVYGYYGTRMCQSCGEENDPLVQMCVAQTGMTPRTYQERHKVAWNE